MPFVAYEYWKKDHKSTQIFTHEHTIENRVCLNLSLN